MTPGPDDQNGELQALLQEIRLADGRLSTPRRVEQAVLAAWDSRDSRDARDSAEPSPSERTGRYWLLVAASIVFAVLVIRWGTGTEQHAPVAETPAPLPPAVEWLDPDPGSLRVLRLRVPTESLRIQHPVFDPSGVGVVDVEMIIGVDGVARSVRLATAE